MIGYQVQGKSKFPIQVSFHHIVMNYEFSTVIHVKFHIDSAIQTIMMILDITPSLQKVAISDLKSNQNINQQSNSES
jgi:hypothetical protein